MANTDDFSYAKDYFAEMDLMYNQLNRESKQMQKFAEEINKIMNKKKWTESIFCNQTGLSGSVYRKIKALTLKKISIQSVVAICVGFAIDYKQSEKLLLLSGFVLNPTIDGHVGYIVVLKMLPKLQISSYENRIDYANEYLATHKQPRINYRNRP